MIVTPLTRGITMQFLISATLFFIFTGTVFASNFADDALKLVPGGSIVQEKKKEVKVKTPQGTIVEVEFDSKGNFEEASGKDLDKDILIPGNDLFSLQTTLESLKKQGKTPTGKWSLENSFLKGWHYEFKGFEDGKKYEYVVDAKTGKLIDTKLDD